MKTLEAIMYITGAIGYMATAFLAIRGYFLLRRQGSMLRSVFSMLSALHLRAAIGQISEMEADLERFVECEDFEAANKMKGILERHKKNTLAALENLKKILGDDATFSIETIQLRPKGE